MNTVMCYVGGSKTAFRCEECGSNCFHHGQDSGSYICNSCGTSYHGEKQEDLNDPKWFEKKIKRCECGSGECVACSLDEIDELLTTNPDYRTCDCGLSCCGDCNYYRSIGKFIPRKTDLLMIFRPCEWYDEIRRLYVSLHDEFIYFENDTYKLILRFV